jgi:hypothetical protein
MQNDATAKNAMAEYLTNITGTMGIAASGT